MFARAGVGFTEIDLRWGLPGGSEEKIVEMCMQEVDRCRGYFVCILGDRYGHVPENADLLRVWGDAHAPAQVSVTELEVRRGAFRAAPGAFVRFYFRRRTADATPDVRLEALKAEVRQRGKPVREYDRAEELSELLLADLDTLCRTAAAAEADVGLVHDRYLHDLSRGVASRPTLWQELDRGLLQQGRGVIVCGPAGGGKTTQLALWADARRAAAATSATRGHGLAAVLNRFRPARPVERWCFYSATAATHIGRWARLLHSLCAAMDDDAEGRQMIGDELTALLLRWHRLVEAACAAGQRVVTVLDGIDDLHLDEVDPLHWLPPPHPLHRCVLVGRDDGPLSTVPKDGWQQVNMPRLLPEERRQALRTYLLAFGKSLPDHWERRVAATAACSSPGHMQVVADEMRLAESPEHLEAMVPALLEAGDTLAVRALVLARMESELGPAVVRSLCCLLWCSRGGLEEAELRAMLVHEHELGGAQWSALSLGFARSATDRAGRLGLFDSVLREAARQRWLTSPDERLCWHRRLVDWFEGERARAGATRRVVEELPWQLRRVSESAALADLLSQPEFLGAAWQHDSDETRANWQWIEACGAAGPPGALAARVVEAPGGETSRRLQAAVALSELGFASAAARLLEVTRDASDEDLQWPAVARGINTVAQLLRSGQIDAAATLLDSLRMRAEGRGVPLPKQLRHALRSAEGSLHLAREHWDAARLAFEEAGRGYAERSDAHAAVLCRHNAALAMVGQGASSEAALVLEDCASRFRVLHDLPGLCATLLHLASLDERKGALRVALHRAIEAEDLANRTGDRPARARALAIKARVLELQGDRDGAEAAQLLREQLLRALGDHEGVAEALLARAIIRVNLGPRGHASAGRLLDEAIRLATESGALGLVRRARDIQQRLGPVR